MPDADILHAVRNAVRIWDRGDGFSMCIGPSRSGFMLEVGVVADDVETRIIHAMKVRTKYVP